MNCRPKSIHYFLLHKAVGVLSNKNLEDDYIGYNGDYVYYNFVAKTTDILDIDVRLNNIVGCC